MNINIHNNRYLNAVSYNDIGNNNFIAINGGAYRFTDPKDVMTGIINIEDNYREGGPIIAINGNIAFQTLPPPPPLPPFTAFQWGLLNVTFKRNCLNQLDNPFGITNPFLGVNNDIGFFFDEEYVTPGIGNVTVNAKQNNLLNYPSNAVTFDGIILDFAINGPFPPSPPPYYGTGINWDISGNYWSVEDPFYGSPDPFTGNILTIGTVSFGGSDPDAIVSPSLTEHIPRLCDDSCQCHCC